MAKGNRPMPVPRPLPKSVLKKMFLKVLHEHKRPGGRYTDHGWYADGIVRETIAEFFKIDPLTEDECTEGLRAVFELEKDGYIMQDPTQSSGFKILTDKGKMVVEQELGEMKLPSIDINEPLSHDILKSKVYDNYLAEDYESAIFKAFRLLEENVRRKASQPADIRGADLMSKAFKPSGGILAHPSAQTSSEAEGFHLLMRGAIMWFKNPSSHRTVGYHDAEEAAQVLCFANLLLDMVEECK